MGRYFKVLAAAAAWLALCAGAWAETTPSALARVDAPGAVVTDQAGHVLIEIPLTQSVPWRARLLDQPPRLIVDFSEVEWDAPPALQTTTISEINVGRYLPGWSRLVAVLREPLAINTAEMVVAEDGRARLLIQLAPTIAEDFRSMADEASDSAPQAVLPTIEPAADDGRLTIALDPGHGGIDPGARAGDLFEADLVLAFARELKEALLRSGRFNVVMTRDDDVFVPLETRLTVARSAGADIFLSLHADALESDAGPAAGITVYTLSDEVTDTAALRLAERHARNDILAGVDLTGTEDEIALVLMDLARQETMPRSEALADTLIEALGAGGLVLNTRPDRHGGFAVLRAADMPSVLIELGFLSNARDRERLASEDWRAATAEAMVRGLSLWSDADEVRQRQRMK